MKDSNRPGNYMNTYSGGRFWPLDPRVEEIQLIDIAVGLARECRWGNQCQKTYSVAEHCCRMVPLVNNLSISISQKIIAKLWCYLHDAAEGYIHDMVKPMKVLHSFKPYCRIENRILQVIAKKFQLPWPMPVVVKELDMVLCVTEFRDLMVHPDTRFQNTEYTPLIEKIKPWTEAKARRTWFEGVQQELANYEIVLVNEKRLQTARILRA